MGAMSLLDRSCLVLLAASLAATAAPSASQGALPEFKVPSRIDATSTTDFASALLAGGAAPANHGLVIATLDGELHGLNADGSHAWRYSLGAKLIEVSSDHENESTAAAVPGAASTEPAPSDKPRLLPYLDGTLAIASQEGAQPVHANVRDIVDASPFTCPTFPGVYLNGARQSQVHTVALPKHPSSQLCIKLADEEAEQDGVASDGCDSGDGCDAGVVEPGSIHVHDDADTCDNGGAWPVPGERLSFAITQYSVSAVDDESEEEVWNFSFREVSGITSADTPSDALELWRNRVDIKGGDVTVRPPSPSDCADEDLGSEPDGQEVLHQFGSEVLAAFVFSAHDTEPGKLGLVKLASAAPELPSFVEGSCCHNPEMLPSPGSPGSMLLSKPMPLQPLGSSFVGSIASYKHPTRGDPQPRPAPELVRVGRTLLGQPHDSDDELLHCSNPWGASFGDYWQLKLVVLLLGAAFVGWSKPWGRVSRLSGVGATCAVVDVTADKTPVTSPKLTAEAEPLPADAREAGNFALMPPNTALSSSMTNNHFKDTFADVALIGTGGFGAVYKAQHRLESNWYAVKMVPIGGLHEDECVNIRRDFQEVSNLLRLRDTPSVDSQHVVRYITCWCEEPRFLPTAASEVARVRGLSADSPGMKAAPSGEAERASGGGAAASASSLSMELSNRFCLPEGQHRLSVDSVSQLESYNASSNDSSSHVCFEAATPSQAPRLNDASSGADRAVSLADVVPGGGVTEADRAGVTEAEMPCKQRWSRQDSLDYKGPRYEAILLIQMELCDGDTLRKWLDSSNRSSIPLDFTAAPDGQPLELRFATHLMRGIRRIHTADMVHRDLKPQNLFVTRSCPTEEWILKIGDFGLSKTGSEMIEEEHGTVGTPAYCAPEGGVCATSSADIYSAAIIILELLSPSFSTAMERAQTLQAFRERRALPQHFSELPDLSQLLYAMADDRPERRPTAGEVHAQLEILAARWPASVPRRP